MPLPDDDDYDSMWGGLQNESPIANPNTDIDAVKLNKMAANVTGMVQTAWRAWALVTLAATTGAMAIVSHGSNWGNKLLVKPTPAHTGTGIFTLTWPTSVTDALLASYTLSLRAAARPSLLSATLYHAQIVSVAANVVTFQVWNSAGALNDAAGVNALITVL